MENKDGTTTYTYDKNGNRISSETNDEKLAYIYDTENRLLAVKDKAGLLMAALYDGDDNRVFTASRKEGKHTYQLFQKPVKSPYTAPGGEEHSLFWYGFSQNVLQALSTLPQTIGTIWHDIFDDVSTAYHQKVAKDRANDEGLVVNPPDLGNLPGEGQVTYASQVKDVLIPYTTREDTFHYYEERNYVNDVNREHTEVLQTYDRELKARETYTYGHGRASYLDNETGDHYQYLTNQVGSVTGLTQDGSPVASSSYTLYGSTKASTDITGNPFAYNGEARDVTELDYLRARYYDSSAGTFLTEDSYQGELTDPLSQNRYSYVHNNPVNYTDPSGHFWKSIQKAWNGVKKAAGNAWNATKKFVGNAWNATKKFVGNAWNATKKFVGNVWNSATSWVGQQWNNATNWVGQQWNNIYHAGQQIISNIASAYDWTVGKIQQGYQLVTNAWEQAKASGQSVYNWSDSKIKEANNIARNWTKALEATIRHVCETAQRAVGGSTVSASTVKFDQSHSAGGYEFKQNLMKQYGFDQSTADLMWKLYQNIKAKEGKNADYVFNRIMGGVIDSYNDWKWDGTAGKIGDVKNDMAKYGISGSQANKLVYNLRIQHDLSSGMYGDVNDLKNKGYYDAFKAKAQLVYGNVDFDKIWNSNYRRYKGKNDFGHQSIIIATHLYGKPRPADIYGVLVGGTNALAGWRGDVTKDAFATPSMGNDDYKSDLDSVNITARMKKQGIDYQTASNQYYDAIHSGSVTRAKEFVSNISINEVKRAIYNSLVPDKVVDVGAGITKYVRPNDAESMDYLKKHQPISYNFIRSLEAGSNDLVNYANR